MDFSLKKLAAATLVLAALSSFTSVANANITPQQSAAILKSFNDASINDFRQFVTVLSKSELAKTDNLGATLDAFSPTSRLTLNSKTRFIACWACIRA